MPVYIIKRITDNHQRRHSFGCCSGFANDIEKRFMKEVSGSEHFKQAGKPVWIEGIACEIDLWGTSAFFDRQQIMIRMVERIVKDAGTQVGTPDPNSD